MGHTRSVSLLSLLLPSFLVFPLNEKLWLVSHSSFGKSSSVIDQQYLCWSVCFQHSCSDYYVLYYPRNLYQCKCSISLLSPSSVSGPLKEFISVISATVPIGISNLSYRLNPQRQASWYFLGDFHGRKHLWKHLRLFGSAIHRSGRFLSIFFYL